MNPVITRMALKRTLKRAAGRASFALSPLVAADRAAVCILVYHRVAEIDVDDPDRDNWNVTPAQFAAHIAALAGWAEFVRLGELPSVLAAAPRAGRPRVCITFDDGFASVHAHALPVLRRYGIPATVFVVTAFIGSESPMPFDRWSQHNVRRAPSAAWRPMTWHQVEDCAASGLIDVGCHSHRHLDGRCCSDDQVADEAGRSRDILRARLGREHAVAYAYPYGSSRLGEVTAAYVHAVKTAGYERAVTSDLGIATPQSDPFRLPRVEAAGVDSPRAIRGKARGSLLPLRLTDRLRSATRTH